MRFDNEAVVITGGASGIGRATALKFSALGAQVLIADTDQAQAEETVAIGRRNGGRLECFVGDMSDSASVHGLVAKATSQYGGIDVLFCNAGIQGALGPTQEYEEAEFDRVLRINTRSVFIGLRAALPGMIARGRGCVVATCSVASLGGMSNLPAYVASKHAVLGLVRSAAMDVARYGVRVNGVCPGAVDTPLLAGVLAHMKGVDPAEAAKRFAASSPMGRLVDPQEVADAVLYLCSPAARSITGTHIVVDGGLSASIGGATRGAA